MDVISGSSISSKKWNALINVSVFSTPFQTPEYFNFFNSVSGLSAEVFAIEEESKLLALCVVTFQKEKGIKSFFSKRAIIYGGPLIAEDERGDYALGLLLSHMNKELKHKVIYAETRNFNDYSLYKGCFLKNDWNYTPYLNFQILLHGKTLDDIIAAMKYNRRREIQLSLKSGAYIKEAENIEDVKNLYVILSDLYANRVKLPLPNLEFFISLYNSCIGKIFIVKHNEKIIGGSFCIYYQGNSIYTLYYCSLRNYHQKIFSTHLAILETIKFGIKNNLMKVDLMGAGKPDEKYGVRKYKSEFGGNMVEYGRFIKIYNTTLFNLGNIGLKIIKKIKR